jgi:hypothetical protein
MQNQASPAQLLFPTVPNSYCPSGDWASIFNSFITLYLNNGTVNIPFLNEVTPQQITTINQNILTIQNKLNAVNWQNGNVLIAASASAQTFTITLPTPINSSNYNISGYFNATAGTASSSASWGIVGTPTSTSFQIWILSNNADITKFTWQVSNLGAL